MNAEAMLKTLEEHHRQIEAGLNVIRRHCDAPVPNIDDLAVARLRLSSASLARSVFVTEVVVPCLVKDSDVDRRAELSALQCKFTAKRQISCEHVAMWTSVTIKEDWAGYRAAARLIWAMMEDQIDKERQYLVERLRNGCGPTVVQD